MSARFIVNLDDFATNLLEKLLQVISTSKLTKVNLFPSRTA
jgi:hypothetical protein